MELVFVNNFFPTYFPVLYPITLPIKAAMVTDISSINRFTSKSFVPHNSPAVNSKGSPGRKNPKKNPVSMVIIINRILSPP